MSAHLPQGRRHEAVAIEIYVVLAFPAPGVLLQAESCSWRLPGSSKAMAGGSLGAEKHNYFTRFSSSAAADDAVLLRCCCCFAARCCFAAASSLLLLLLLRCYCCLAAAACSLLLLCRSCCCFAAAAAAGLLLLLCCKTAASLLLLPRSAPALLQAFENQVLRSLCFAHARHRAPALYALTSVHGMQRVALAKRWLEAPWEQKNIVILRGSLLPLPLMMLCF